MLESKDVKFMYESYLKDAAKYKNINCELFNYFQGVVHAYGNVLGYEYSRIKKDIEDTTEQLQKAEESSAL